MLSSKLIGIVVVRWQTVTTWPSIHGRQTWLGEKDIEPLDELDELDEDQRDAQAEALLNATTFGAMYFVIGKQDISMAFYAEISLMQRIEVPCQTLEQRRRALMFVPPAAT